MIKKYIAAVKLCHKEGTVLMKKVVTCYTLIILIILFTTEYMPHAYGNVDSYNGNKSIPLRQPFERLGFLVNWDDQTLTVTAVKNNTIAKIKVGELSAILNGKNIALDTPAYIINDRIMVPIQFAREVLGPELDMFEEINPLFKETDPSKIISLKTEDDVVKKRDELIKYIWKNKELPTNEIPSKIDVNIKDNRYDDLANLKRIDVFTVLMEYQVNSIVYYFVPEKSNHKLVIYYQGHDGDFLNGKEVIRMLLDKGYSVVALSMPLYGMNNKPIVNLENVGVVMLSNHNHLAFLDSNEFSSIKFFVHPITVSLNYLIKTYGYNDVFMVGISGGGWATTLYSAIDSRIQKSYPVAGSYPLYFRFDTRTNDWGDYEQNLPELYRIANYLELYVMGAHGQNRNQIQIINKYDTFFAGIKSRLYERVIQDILEEIRSGSFKVFIDDTHHEHKVSDRALEIIFSDMEN